MVTINFAGMVPSVGKLTIIKIFLKTAFLTVFSPISLVMTLLLTLGVVYLLSLITYSLVSKKFDRKEQNSFVKKVFSKNKSVVVILLLIGFFLNFSINKNSIVLDATNKANQYDKVCTLIANEEMGHGYSDEQVMKDMDASGCNGQALPIIKFFNLLSGKGKSDKFPVTPRGNWYQRDENQA